MRRMDKLEKKIAALCKEIPEKAEGITLIYRDGRRERAVDDLKTRARYVQDCVLGGEIEGIFFEDGTVWQFDDSDLTAEDYARIEQEIMEGATL